MKAVIERTLDAASASKERNRDDGRYWIPDSNLDKLLANLAKLAKRAGKLGSVPPTLVEHERVAVVSKKLDAFGDVVEVVSRYTVVSVVGVAPVLAGWAFIATIESANIDGEALNVLSIVPGETVPASYRTADASECDHCKTIRSRNRVFVVRHEDGTHKQVGSTCIKDFLGHADPATIVAYAQLLASLDLSDYEDEDERSGGHSESSTDLLGFLAKAAAFIRMNGWVSRARASNSYGAEHATADDVVHDVFDRCKHQFSVGREHCEAHVEATEADIIDATEAIAWAIELGDKQEPSDYEWNVYVVARSGYVTRKRAGIAASIVAVYQKERGRLLEKERREAFKDSAQNVWFGTEKERVSLTVSPVKLDVYDGDYGDRTRVRFITQSGAVAVWWASGNVVEEWEPGKYYIVKATIKKHEDWKGEKQTVLTRVKKEGS